ncbi:hypothetical protein [Paludisphaera borealis]|uniref:Uncharacterized protein n=1 Tax=Paludisphaera borealis TaxID=1387353 RepID=A0A1U7CYP8_9BACT|nr:hypothetical protein [Paludisphaera borealis]APW64013.1 hypothetical protein BSF38_05602 [Paludisphaera borealis]
MRLTLRTLLAWLDDTLPPVQVREIGKQVADSPLAQELVQRIHRVTRQRRLTVPSKNGADATDPNLVASYLDNDLEPEKVAEYEKKCLTSDVNLAEAASVHQILSLLGQKVQVPAEAKARMYQLVKGREAQPAPPSNGAPVEPESVTKPIPPWVVAPPPRRRSLERFGPLAACLGLISLLCWSAYESLQPEAAVTQDPGELQLRMRPTHAAPALAKADATPETEPETASAENAHPADAVADVENVAEKPEAPKTDAATTPGDATADAAKPAVPSVVAPKGEPLETRKIPEGAVGVASKIEGILLRYNIDKREWERLAEGAAIHTSDRLLVLAPFRAVVATGKSALDVQGDTEFQLLQKDPTEEPVVGIVHGRVAVEPSSSPAALHCMFAGRTVNLEQPANAAIGFELMNRWTYGQPTAGAAVLGVHAANGEISLSMDKAKEKLSGPGTILATASGHFNRPAAAKPPGWAIEPERSPEATELRTRFRKEFSIDRPVLADLVSATENENAEIKTLAIAALRALGDLSLLTPILDRPGDPIARRAAIAAIREQASLGGPSAQRAWDQLEADFGPADGAKLERLLVGFGDEEAAKTSTLRALVDDLSPRNEALGVRELAFDNLRTLTGRTTIPYDADHPEPGFAAWNHLVEAGTLKLDPKRKPPM